MRKAGGDEIEWESEGENKNYYLRAQRGNVSITYLIRTLAIVHLKRQVLLNVTALLVITYVLLRVLLAVALRLGLDVPIAARCMLLSVHHVLPHARPWELQCQIV